jgi:dethiobiotin synthetase
VKRPFRVFVTATDTGVGKTETSCALLSLMREAGLNPAGFKPYESGCKRLDAPADALALREAAGSKDALDDVCPHRFRESVAPGVAAKRLGVWPSFARTQEAFRSFRGRPLVVEGAGGLFVPVDASRDVIDLIAQFNLPVLLVARAGLGTLNHTGLSLEALARRRRKVAAILLVKSSPGRDVSEEDNAQILEQRYGVRVLGPVPYRKNAAARRAAFREALRPLLQ